MIVMTLFLILGLAVLAAAGSRLTAGERKLKVAGTAVGLLFILISFLSTSWVYIGADSIGQLEKRLFGKDLPQGRNIAINGEKGKQARFLKPGLHISPLINIVYRVHKADMVVVPSDQCLLLTALDGIPLPEGQAYAPEWDPDLMDKMLDPEFFLNEGNGYKGPQSTVLPPGRYLINAHLWESRPINSTVVPEGWVAVVKANFGPIGADWLSTRITPDMELQNPVVKRGGAGIWEEPLYPKTYYINTSAYNLTLVNTQVLSMMYAGGFTKRTYPLHTQQDGTVLHGDVIEEVVPVIEGAADVSVMAVTADGYKVPMDFRIQCRVKPENAPFLVASIGTVHDLEDKVITPVLRSELRNKTQNWKVEQLVANRSSLEASLEEVIIQEAVKFFLTVQDLRIGHIESPAEMLAAIGRRELAIKNREAIMEEKKTQFERIATEQQRALANLQGELQEAEIQKQKSVLFVETRRNDGKAELEYAKGVREAMAQLKAELGSQGMQNYKLMELVLGFMAQHPELVKMNQTLVQVGQSGGDVSGPAVAATLLGNSNLAQSVRDILTASSSEDDSLQVPVPSP